MDPIEAIKTKIDIVSLISEYFPLKKAGRNFKALCPFHSEKTPSFIVSPERRIWHCFGSCGEGGDIFKFLMKVEQMEFPEALRFLAKKAGVVLPKYVPTDREKIREKLYAINHLTSEFYHFLLIKHKIGQKAQEYLKKRQIEENSKELFKLGFAPDMWDGLIKFLVGKKGYDTQDLELAGLVIKGEKGKYYDRFRNRLMFALEDHRGNIIGFAGRLLEEEAKDLPAGRQEPKYVNTPETPIYLKGNTLYGLSLTKEAIRKENQAIIVEGEFDVIQSYQAGIKNVVAIKGSALTPGQIDLLKRYTENIALALDSDLAGDLAIRRGIETADSAGLNIKVIQLASGKDPDECVRQDKNLWEKSVRKAVPIYDFFLDSALKKHNVSDVLGKKKIAEEIFPVLSKITNLVVRSHYLKKIARILEISEEISAQEILSFQTKTKTIGLSVAKTLSLKRREEILEEYFISLILQSKDTKQSFSLIEEAVGAYDFFLPSLRKIFNFLKDYLKLKKEPETSDFINSLPPELAAIADRLYLSDLGGIYKNKGVFEKELLKNAREIKKLSLRRKMREITGDLKKAEKEEEKEELIKEFKKTSEELKTVNDLF